LPSEWEDGGEGGTLPQLEQNQRVSANILTDKPDFDTSSDTWRDTFWQVDVSRPQIRTTLYERTTSGRSYSPQADCLDHSATYGEAGQKTLPGLHVSTKSLLVVRRPVDGHPSVTRPSRRWQRLPIRDSNEIRFRPSSRAYLLKDAAIPSSAGTRLVSHFDLLWFRESLCRALPPYVRISNVQGEFLRATL